MRKFVGAVAILAISFGVAMAEEIKGRIVKIDDKKVSFQTFDKETKKFGDAKDYDLAKDCKFCTMLKDEKKELEGGLKASRLQKIDPEKGVGAKLNVVDGKVTEIILSGKKKKSN